MMEFLELAKNRYSERSFASKSLEEEILYKILEAGRIAPTACNYQPQRFYVLKSKEALAKAAGLTYTYNAPVVILVCYLSAEAWHNPRDGFCSGDMDASIAASSMMFEAEDLGVHSIWLRGFDAGKVQEALISQLRLSLHSCWRLVIRVRIRSLISCTARENLWKSSWLSYKGERAPENEGLEWLE